MWCRYIYTTWMATHIKVTGWPIRIVEYCAQFLVEPKRLVQQHKVVQQTFQANHGVLVRLSYRNTICGWSDTLLLLQVNLSAFSKHKPHEPFAEITWINSFAKLGRKKVCKVFEHSPAGGASSWKKMGRHRILLPAVAWTYVRIRWYVCRWQEINKDSSCTPVHVS